MQKQTALWRKIGKKEHEQIRKQAKAIMDNFATALAKAEKSQTAEKSEPKETKQTQTRKETQTKDKTQDKQDKEFRKAFFKILPKKEGDYAIAEKGKWK